MVSARDVEAARPARGDGRAAHADALDAHDLRARGGTASCSRPRTSRAPAPSRFVARQTQARRAGGERGCAKRRRRGLGRATTPRRSPPRRAHRMGVPLRGLRPRRRADRQGRGRARGRARSCHLRRPHGVEDCPGVREGGASARGTASPSSTRSTIRTIVAGQGTLGLELLEDVPGSRQGGHPRRRRRALQRGSRSRSSPRGPRSRSSESRSPFFFFFFFFLKIIRRRLVDDRRRDRGQAPRAT